MRKKNNTSQIKKANNNGKKERFSSEVTIERCPHNRENPYVLINRDLIRNQEISPDCRTLICFLLCNKDDFIIDRTNIQNQFSPWWGRDKVDSLIKEAIENGYLRKEVKEKYGFVEIIKLFLIENPSFSKKDNHTDKPLRQRRNSKKEQEDIYIYKEVVKKRPDKSPPHTEKTPPSSAITTAFPPGKKENKNKPQMLLTEQQIAGLEDKFGKAMIDNLRRKSGELAKKDPKAFTKKSEHDYVYDWARIELNKKATRFTKKEGEKEDQNISKNKGGTLEDVSYDIEEKRKKEFADYIKITRENPANRAICHLIRYNGGCTRVELFHVNNNSVDSINYNDPTYWDKMKKWMQEIAEELKCDYGK